MKSVVLLFELVIAVVIFLSVRMFMFSNPEWYVEENVILGVPAVFLLGGAEAFLITLLLIPMLMGMKEEEQTEEAPARKRRRRQQRDRMLVLSSINVVLGFGVTLLTMFYINYVDAHGQWIDYFYALYRHDEAALQKIQGTDEGTEAVDPYAVAEQVLANHFHHDPTIHYLYSVPDSENHVFVYEFDQNALHGVGVYDELTGVDHRFYKVQDLAQLNPILPQEVKTDVMDFSYLDNSFQDGIPYLRIPAGLKDYDVRFEEQKGQLTVLVDVQNN